MNRKMDSDPTFLQQLERYFLTGLAVVVPLWGTVLILTTLFNAVDGALVAVLGPVASS